MQWPHLLIGTEKERGQRCCLTKKTKKTAPRAGGRGDVWHRGFQRGVDRRRSETRAVVPRGIQRRGRHGTIVPSPGRRCVRARGGSIDARVPSRGMRRGGDRGIEAAGVRGSGRSETHQGARNLTKAALPDSRTSASKFFAVRSTAPALAPTTRPIRAIARNATRILTCGGRTRGADQSIIPGTVRQRIGTRDRAGGDVRIAARRARCVLEGEDGRSRRFTRRMGHVPEASLRDLEWVTAGTFVRFVPRRHATFFDQSEASICFLSAFDEHGFRFSNKSHRTPH